MPSKTQSNDDEWRIERMFLSKRTIRRTMKCGDAYDILATETDVPALAVVDEDGIHGLIDRQSLLTQFARPIMRDVYERRSVELIMDRQPLVVDARMMVADLSERIGSAKPSALTAGFIVTRDGAFFGVGTVIEMIRLAAAESRHRAREIEAAQHSLIQAEKLASLGGLVAGIAHEINTPIGIGLTAASTMQEFTQAFRRKVDEGVLRKSDLYAFLDVAAKSSSLLVTHMSRAAQLVQSFKQIAVDRTNADRRRFELRGYLDEVLVSLQPVTKKRQVTILLDCPPDLIIDSYPGALSQIVVNFVMNSMTHAFDAGATGALSLTARRIDGDRIELVYADDGSGIAPDALPRIFDPFFTTKRGQGGSGLGLHIVYNLVTKKLGGRIDVASTLGEGTRFILILPVTAPEGSDDPI